MKSKATAAFTLLELLISLAIMAALFAALSQFMFSMGELWGRGSARRLFEQHATAVSHHLQSMMLAGASGTKVEVAESPLAGAPVLVHLDLPGGDRVFAGLGPPETGIVSYLKAEAGRGLLLYWSAPRSEGVAAPELRVCTLSRFGCGIRYEYYDRASRRLSVQDLPQRDAAGEWARPCRLHLQFAWNDLQTTRAVVVPALAGGLADF